MLTTVKVKKQQIAEGGMKRPGQVWSQAKEKQGSRRTLPASSCQQRRKKRVEKKHNQNAPCFSLSHKRQHPQHVMSK